jgi:hypothetical protein
VNDPGSWEEPEPHDHLPPNPEFDRIVQASGFRFHVYDALQDDYRLTPAEADRATTDYLAGRTTDPGAPAEVACTAVADAYALWATTADPAIVAGREADRRINGIDADIPDDGGDLDSEERGSMLTLNITRGDLATAAGPDTGGFLYNTAYLAGAAATLAELAVTAHSDRDGGNQAPAAAGRSGSAAQDLAAAEAAITLLRENRDRHGYTAEDAETAQALRSVLDAAQVWDEVPSPTPVDQTPRLEEDLRPDRVRPRPRFDDTVILDAGFAGATITVQRSGPAHDPGQYQFLTDGLGGRGPLRDVDTAGIGVIAAGDREPRPDRADVYAELGAEVRQHLIGLADAVAVQREALHVRETQRMSTAHITTTPTVQPGHQRSL